MRTATLLGEDLPTLTARLDARATLRRWAASEPALALHGDVGGVVAALRPQADPSRWDTLLGALVRLAAANGGDEQDAVLLLLHLLDAGAARLRRRFPADLVLGQLTICVRAFPWATRTRAYAANLLLDTEKALCREMHPSWARYRRDADRLVDPTSRDPRGGLNDLDRTVPADTDDELDLVDLLAWAQRTGIVNPRDLAMLVQYFRARGEGINAGHDHVARLHGVTARTSRRRCAAALQALQTNAMEYLAA